MVVLLLLVVVVGVVLVVLVAIPLMAVGRYSATGGRTQTELYAIRRQLDVGLVKNQITADAARFRRELDNELDEFDRGEKDGRP